MEYRIYTSRHFDQIEQLQRLPASHRFAMQVISQVLPFRVNRYVIEQLIDWDNIPADPIFHLCFPQPGMLSPAHFNRIASLMQSDAPEALVREAASAIRLDLNPHPAEQLTLNVPKANGLPLAGVQHKYRETVLFFPSQGQNCFTYCAFCFRWPQFIGQSTLKIGSTDNTELLAYLKNRPEVSDLLVTGGDPLVMKADLLKHYLEPLLQPAFAHIHTIRIGTKALSYWPYRFLSDPDADDLLRLFEHLIQAGKHLALMVHFNHWRELEPQPVREAIARLRATGAILRSQSPLLAHINDDSQVWQTMWSRQVRLGIIPYYMFVVRDTGARCYFEVTLDRAWDIYRQAIQRVSGLARTVRGPSMSAGPGKVEIQGVATVKGEKVFVLRFLQGRNPGWVQQPFFARYDETATWLDQLVPAFKEPEFFFENEYKNMIQASSHSADDR